MKITNIIKCMCICFAFSQNLIYCQANPDFWNSPNSVNGHVDGNIRKHSDSSQTLQSFELQSQFGTLNAFQLADQCRNRIISQLSTKKEKILSLMHVENITEPMKNILQEEIRTLKLYNQSVGYSQDAILKLSLLASRKLPWATTMECFSEMYPDGIFQKYTFEDTVFILFLQPKHPMLTKYLSKYKKDICNYTGWLTGAMKKYLEETNATSIEYQDPEKKQSLLQNTLLQIATLLSPPSNTEKTYQASKKED